ncbi:DUF4291 family protein [Kitasatospora sp. NPDC058478]|uniref:DUF4291 family protein n=1 Tax=unclassified Kitasatospora TaxID=2633591 RepID=UPI003647641E
MKKRCPATGCRTARAVRHPPASTTWKRQLKRAPARVQWDPERDLHLQPLPHRSLQLGLAGEAAERYAEQWIVSIDDVTALAHTIQAQVRDGALEAARQLLPAERPYPVDDALLNHLRG